MRRESERYHMLTIAIFDIYRDYGFCVFPIDVELVCKKMSVLLKRYSEYNKETQELFVKRSRYGFFARGWSKKPPTIYYNDKFGSIGAIRLTILHEIKHYVFNEDSSDEEYDDLATFFARSFLCPIPYLMIKGIETPETIASHCLVSLEAANNVASNIQNRKKWYGNAIFGYEEDFLRFLDEGAYEEFIRSQGGKEVSVIVLCRL